jgi:hypothetical protein
MKNHDAINAIATILKSIRWMLDELQKYIDKIIQDE